jgi:hypothetical protein
MNYIKSKITCIAIVLFVITGLITSCQKQVDPGNWDIHWPIINFSYSPPTPLIGDTIHFQGQMKSGSSNIVKWEWSFGDSTGTATTATGENASLAFDKKGTYQVSLMGTDSLGNTGYVSKTITVLEDTGMLIKVMVCCAKPGTFNEASYQQMADIINTYKPDLVLMRQVDSSTSRSLDIDVPAYVASRTGMYHYFGKAFDYKGGGYGNALLSRFPITDSATISLPPDPALGGEMRSLPVITVQLNDKQKHKLVFAGTELDASKEDSRVYQVNSILAHLGGSSYPVILGGDFNDNPGSNVFNLLESKFSLGCTAEGCPVNNPKVNPTKTYAYVFYSSPDNLILSRTSTVNESISKYYLPIMVEVRYKPNK